MEQTTPMPKAPWRVSTLLAFAFLIAGTVVFLSFALEPYAYNVFVAIHVLASVLWVGGDITLTTLGIRYERLQDGPTLAALGKMGTWIGTRIYTPTLFLVIAFGIAALEKGNLPWDRFWVVFGLVGWTLAAVIGIGFVGPELGRIEKAAAQFGPDSDEARRRVKRLFMIFRFDTALLMLIVLDMAAKPSF